MRLDIGGVNKVVYEDLKIDWDELDFIGVKKVRRPSVSISRNSTPPRLAQLGVHHTLDPRQMLSAS